jgi:hypothetical protein
MEVSHLFTEEYLQAGETITGTIVGESTNGTTNQYPTNKFSGTGAPGKKATIGRNKIPGAYGVCNVEHDHRNLPG